MPVLNEIFDSIIGPGRGDTAAAFSQYLLSLKFTDEQIARYESLAYRNQDGNLTPEELAELDAFLKANTLLAVVQLKARRSLIQQSPAA